MGWWLAFAACSGGDKGGPPPGDDDDDDDTAAVPDDSAPEGGTLEVAFWAVSVAFAVDGATQSAVTAGDREGGLRPVSLTVTLLTFDALYQGQTDDNACSATFEIAAPVAPAAWSADVGAWIGFDLPVGGEVQDRCRFYALPPQYAGALAPHVQSWSWGAGLATLDPDTEATLRAQLPASEWDAIAPYVVGGGVRSDVFSGGADPIWLGGGIALGYQVDGNFVLAENALGDPLPIASGDVWTGAAVGTGYYEVQVGLFDAPDALTFVPY